MRYDFINTFFYKNLAEIPKLINITLNLGCQKSSFKSILSGLLALEFISSKRSKVTTSKHLNIFLKIKKGNPVGCKIILRKNAMYFFYLKLITSIFSKIKQPQTYIFQKQLKMTQSLSFQLKSSLLFTELENQFQFFKNIPRLNVVILTNSKSQKEFFFFFKSVKFLI